ncbi:IS1595 family transposase [Methylocystis sp. Sn-Cys]|uniref:IS1595 family transposase n=1 Tax=Methylocystis sp. Sn-Cys TaxID=1701263 RepID=UPI0019250D21|nr:IS1595 family transposase [Methylocystis sp. Sn-Cys]MBL1255856.1 IS1595 family transposase [Methylocystis sp. Sn-Cys]
MTNLTDPIFTDEAAARAHFERIRWPDGKPVCPHCGVVDQATRLEGKSHRPGLFVCRSCREHFTVTVGTVMESSHVPLNKWALGFHLMASSKKGISAHQLMRNLGLGSYRTAWFMAHRIREAMADRDPEPLGGEGKTVEVDETFISKPGQRFVTGKGWQGHRGAATKQKVLTMVERGGRSVSIKVDDLTILTIKKVLGAHVVLDSTLNTDEAQHYKKPGKAFAAHESVNHGSGEYVRGETTTNTVEGYFGIFKRGMRGVYHHCGEQHLQAYLNEFDFRYSNRSGLGVDDTERTHRAIRGGEGKRLKYR